MSSSSFRRRIYAEVEELGWEHLVKMGEDLKFLSFRFVDDKGIAHIVEITLDSAYPKCPPSVSADVPYIFDLKWLPNSKLKDVFNQFREHVNKLSDFWAVLADIDGSLCVINHSHSNLLATSYRQIRIGDDCSIMLYINASDPYSLPECRFLGSNAEVVRNAWCRNRRKWERGKSFSDNLACIFEARLHKPPRCEKGDDDEGKIECGICYSRYLPMDDELGDKSGTSTDYTCENVSCKRCFHSICLADWLRSITTTRQSFDVLFGSCPLCSDPIALKIGGKKY